MYNKFSLLVQHQQQLALLLNVGKVHLKVKRNKSLILIIYIKKKVIIQYENKVSDYFCSNKTKIMKI